MYKQSKLPKRVLKMPVRQPDEPRYVEFDETTEYWSVFGENSGFCYAQFNTEEEAKGFLSSK